MTDSPATEVDSAAHGLTAHAWWREVGTAALLGTARRPVPPLSRLGVHGLALGEAVRADEALLTSAALGGAALLAGRPPGPMSAGTSADDDALAAAPRLAVQLLELVLAQPPAGAQQRNTLLVHWLRTAAAAGRRAPHSLLPTLLDVATGSRELRRPTALVLDRRGEWLARQRPDWAWVADALAGATNLAAAGMSGSTPTDPELEHAAPPTPDEWARLPSSQRPAVIGVLRSTHAAAARALVESTWRTDSAKDRRAHLDALAVGLGPDDEALLERALDDRAATVREGAAALLDGLPGSARAARMAARLRPLIRTTGVLRRTLDVALPDEPDPSGVRDGLGKPPPRRSARGWWLERIAAGAPLDVWTDASGVDPTTTVSRLSDADALSGIRQALRLRRDATWAAAVLQRFWDPQLLTALGRSDQEQAVLARLSAGDASAPALLASLTAPWSSQFSTDVLARLHASKLPALHLAQAMPHLVAGLHPDALGPLEAWQARAGNDNALSTHLRNLLQFHSVKRSITEAFR